MKRICKIFAVLLVMAIALFSFSITAGATEVSNTQDGLVASIISEKDSYKSNEDIELTFKVTNTNDFAVENVSLEAIIPDGLTLKNNDNTTINTVSLASGESLELTLTAVKESSVITVPIGDSTEPNTENTTVVQTDSIQATTAKVNSATSDTVSTNSSDNTTIQTGKTMSYLLVGLICLVCLAVAVISFRFRKKTVKYLSLVLCVCIAVGSVAFVSVTNTMAQETSQQMSFEVSKTIIVDNKNYTFSANVDYEFNPYFSLTDFKADTFDIYLNEEKTVTFTCKVNSNKSIGEEDIAVYNKDSQFIVYMNDNGINGDMVANDGIYSAQATLSSTNFELIGYYATAFNCKSNIFEINFYRDLTSEEMSLFNNLHTTIADLSFLEACKYVEKSEEIDTYFIDEAHQTITYTTKYHITGIWEKEKEGSFKGSGKLSIPTTDGRDYEKAKQLIDKYYFSSKLKKKNIMVLRPFRSTEFLYDDFKYSGQLLSSALNSNLVIADNGNVTISSMKMLNSYGIVLIDSHGTLVKGKAPHIVIGEKYQKNQSYSADYSSGRICVTGKKNLTIGSQFIEKYYQNKSLMNTFLFLGTCYSGYLNDIPSSLSSSGAEIVIGFTDSVSVDYCNNALFEIITNSMVLSKDTLENGVQLTKSYYGDYDPNNSNCEITMQGNISYKIIDEIKDKLFGTVKERDTNFSLSNVRVDAYLKAESGIQYVGNTYTDDKGNFSMELQGGSYELRFNKDGYKTATTTIKISKDVMTVLKDPIVMEKENNKYVSVSLGSEHSAAITENGDLYMWGSNGNGQLGDGTTIDKKAPTKIMSNVKSVSLGRLHTAAITNNGDLYMWGENGDGQLGNGTTTSSNVPIKIMSNVKSVSLGWYYYSAAITENGDLYTWGFNGSGQLGDGTTYKRYNPTKIMSNVKSVSLGSDHSAAITENDDLYTWGNNGYGKLGDGTTYKRHAPTKIMSNIKSVELGQYHSAAITNNGDLYTWGDNGFGQLGTGETGYKSIPTKIMSNVKTVSLGFQHSASITENGELYTWGKNWSGELGNGTVDGSNIPQKIMNKISLVSLGDYYSAAITENSDLYLWGVNTYGQLGNGTTNSSTTPIKLQ